MNTIPLTFNERLCNCTVLGGKETLLNVRYPISVLLLSRNPGNYKEQSLNVLINSGFENIITIESTRDNFKLEKYVQNFPQVKFIVPSEKTSVGDLINLGMAECRSEYLLVLWDDLVIKNRIFNDLLVSKILATQCACFCPVFANSISQNIPVKMRPHIKKGSFDIIPSQVVYDNTATLFPYDFVGVYNREKFVSVGGFDSTIKSSYWQNLDFSIRNWLCGEKIISSPIFKFTYEMSEPIYDSTIDGSYFRFYLKNIAPVFKKDYAYIPLTYFFQFHRRSSFSFSNAMKEFKMVRKWVSKNAYHFKMDIKTLTEKWESL